MYNPFDLIDARLATIEQIMIQIQSKLHHINLDNLPKKEEKEVESVIYTENTYIDDLDMSVRLYNGLKRQKIYTLGPAKNLSFNEFCSFNGLGPKSWDELQKIIKRSKTSK